MKKILAVLMMIFVMATAAFANGMYTPNTKYWHSTDPRDREDFKDMDNIFDVVDISCWLDYFYGAGQWMQAPYTYDKDGFHVCSAEETMISEAANLFLLAEATLFYEIEGKIPVYWAFLNTDVDVLVILTFSEELEDSGNLHWEKSYMLQLITN